MGMAKKSLSALVSDHHLYDLPLALLSFATNHCIVSTLDHEDFYEGRLFGETNSHVSAHLEDGMMTASIHVGDETYHIEVSQV